ncbi:hypothetical protein ColTof4_09709 [Colletotrichum tofieldiae]|nr:hypothetical protein ColTof3_05062 [Colletotrichum tofieldiae]GKT77286.1 hypothetical protein ColTof4_09709 [Colletotrichum tofieldiae]
MSENQVFAPHQDFFGTPDWASDSTKALFQYDLRPSTMSSATPLPQVRVHSPWDQDDYSPARACYEPSESIDPPALAEDQNVILLDRDEFNEFKV